MRKQKASALIFSLWVLIFLTMLVVSIGHRVILGLRLSRYQQDRIKAYCLAKAGVNRAISEILKDPNPNCDSLEDGWRNNEKVFKEIILGADNNDFATVSYFTKAGSKAVTVFGVTDEESKININTVPQGLLEELLSKIGVSNPVSVAQNICSYRGVVGSGKLFRVEELLLVEGITPDIFQALNGLITVYGQGVININTASIDVLEILGDYCAKKGVDINFPVDLAGRIVSARQKGQIFASLDEFKAQLPQEGADILNNLAGVKSTCFYIESNGRINHGRFRHAIKVVFDRSSAKIVYWYEN